MGAPESWDACTPDKYDMIKAPVWAEQGLGMYYTTYLLKYGEIGVKGKNRATFEDALVSQAKRALEKVEGQFNVYKEQGRVLVDVKGCEGSTDYEEIISALKTVFGVVGICPVLKAPLADPDAIAEKAIIFMAEAYGLTPDELGRKGFRETADSRLSTPAAEASRKALENFRAEGKDPDSLYDSAGSKPLSFKISCRRANKAYPVPSMEVACYAGGRLLDAFPGKLEVDVHKPEVMLHIELREEVFIYSKIIPGPGGMPVGTNGRAMLCLSGGIDSPVAGWMIAKRGVSIDATYFHAPPYTSERAKQKVVDLAKIISRYTGPIRLHVVNFTDIQLAIYEKCPKDELTIIMRRYMMRIAEHFAREDGDMALITGESIGQVASQTTQSLVCTDEVCTMPVFRPLIGFDKQDIIDLSEKIGSYETSILPFEDCCTIFVAKHPVTKPRLDVIRRSETKLDDVIEDLMEKAVGSAEMIRVR